MKLDVVEAEKKRLEATSNNKLFVNAFILKSNDILIHRSSLARLGRGVIT